MKFKEYSNDSARRKRPSIDSFSFNQVHNIVFFIYPQHRQRSKIVKTSEIELLKKTSIIFFIPD